MDTSYQNREEFNAEMRQLDQVKRQREALRLQTPVATAPSNRELLEGILKELRKSNELLTKIAFPNKDKQDTGPR